MRNPKFWYRNTAYSRLVSFFLYPLSLIYGLGRKLDVRFSKSKGTDILSIAIGGATVGGAGKTPVTAYIYDIFNKEGFKPIIISRGYGGQIENYLIDVNTISDVKIVGDEAVMLNRKGYDVIVTDDKVRASSLAKNFSDVLLLDDAIQSTNIHASKNILVVDAEQGFGNGRLLPAGPLREDLEILKNRIHAVVIIGDDRDNKIGMTFEGVPIFYAEKVLKLDKLDKQKELFAFCGLGFPDNFFNSLEKAGCCVKERLTFPDHYYYKNLDIEAMLSYAKKKGLQLVTTEKDIVKISPKFRSYIEVAELNINFLSNDDFIKFLQGFFNK